MIVVVHCPAFSGVLDRFASKFQFKAHAKGPIPTSSSVIPNGLVHEKIAFGEHFVKDVNKSHASGTF